MRTDSLSLTCGSFVTVNSLYELHVGEVEDERAPNFDGRLRAGVEFDYD